MEVSFAPVEDVPGAASVLAGWYERLPSLLAALLIVLAGWLIARAARGGARHVADHLNRFLDRSLRWGSLASARVPSSAIAVIGEILFWLVLLLSIALGARVAGIAMVTVWFDQAAAHLPHLLIGTTIIVGGWLIGSKIGSGGESGESIPRRCAQALVVALTMIVGFEQIGLDMRLPVVLLGIAVGATFLAFSVAFGLGARDYVSANIASRALTSQLQRGMRINSDQHEGELIEITATHLLLDTEAGHVLLPLSNAMNVSIIIQRSGEAGSSDDE